MHQYVQGLLMRIANQELRWGPLGMSGQLCTLMSSPTLSSEVTTSSSMADGVGPRPVPGHLPGGPVRRRRSCGHRSATTRCCASLATADCAPPSCAACDVLRGGAGQRALDGVHRLLPQVAVHVPDRSMASMPCSILGPRVPGRRQLRRLAPPARARATATNPRTHV